MNDQPILTWRERRVLVFIRDTMARRSYPPTVREIGAAVGLASTSSVTHVLSALQEKGCIQRVPGKPRAITVTVPEAEGTVRT